MNATMPMALPRGPNRRIQTAREEHGDESDVSDLAERGEQRCQCDSPDRREEEQQRRDDPTALLSVLDRRGRLHRDDRAEHGDRDRLMSDAGERQQRDDGQNERQTSSPQRCAGATCRDRS